MTDGAATGGGLGGGPGAGSGRPAGRQPAARPSRPASSIVISAYSGSTTGNGGHYYSARDIAATLQAGWPGARLRILVLGDLAARGHQRQRGPVHARESGRRRGCSSTAAR